MRDEIKKWLAEIDEADKNNRPWRRSELSDAFIDYIRDLFKTDDRLIEICNAERDGLLEIYTKEQKEAKDYLNNYSSDDDYFDEEYS